MPQAISLVVKNGASTPVDKTFTLISPAAGDGSLAEWALKEGPISSVFPTMTAMATSNSNARKLKIKVRLPTSYQEVTTGLTRPGVRAEMNVDFTIPVDFPEAQKDDYVAFCVNLLGHTLTKSMIRDAYSAS